MQVFPSQVISGPDLTLANSAIYFINGQRTASSYIHRPRIINDEPILQVCSSVSGNDALLQNHVSLFFPHLNYPPIMNSVKCHTMHLDTRNVCTTVTLFRGHLPSLHMHVLQFPIYKYRAIAIFQLAPISRRNLIVCCPLPARIQRACLVCLLAYSGGES